MYLKKIILNGFKSFADKTIIPCEKGITGIIGPNGSGKSNIIDAVRWVMGEQSAKNLRGKVSTDIIFAGSAKRKPLGMAEVVLVFDNTEESEFCPPEYRHEQEISITRRIYIDGQREYFINKTSCRFKDIANFFVMSGLGGKSYSMIQQGEVERILNAKPEDVRYIIEEAAGTAIYKLRRDEALRKLTTSKENLARIEDILVELQRQYDVLKDQMQKAKEWQNLNEELKKKELWLFKHDYDKNLANLINLQQKISSDNQKEAELLAEVSKYETIQVELQQTLDMSNPDLQKLNDQLSANREEVARCESTLKFSLEKVDNLKKTLEQIQNEIHENQDNLVVLEKQLHSSQEELSVALSQFEDSKSIIENYQQQIDLVDEEAKVLESKIEDLEDELKSIQRLLENNSLKCETLNRERDKIKKQIQLHEDKLTTIANDLKLSQDEFAINSIKLEEKQAGLKELFNKKQDLENRLQELFKNLDALIQEKEAIKNEYINTKAHYQSLDNLKFDISDVASFIKSINETNNDILKNIIIGMFADFVEFNKNSQELTPQAKSIIEKWSEIVIVNNLKDLDFLVKNIETSKEMTMSFSIVVLSQLEEIDIKHIQQWAHKTDAQCLNRYLNVTDNQNIINKILDRLYYLPSLVLDIKEMSDVPTGIIVFTAQGIMYNNKGFFLIKSKDGQGLLTQKTQLNILFKELQQSEQKLVAIQNKIDILEQQKADLDNELLQISQVLQQQNEEVLNLLADLKGAQQILENKQILYNTAKTQVESLYHSDKELLEELKAQEDKRLWLSSEYDRVNKELNDVRQDFEGIEDKRQEIQNQLDISKRDFAKSEGRLSALKQSYDRTQEQYHRAQQILVRKIQDKQQIEQQIEDTNKIHNISKEQILKLLEVKTQLEQDLLNKREENTEIVEKMHLNDLKLKELTGKLMEVQKITAQKDFEIEKIKANLENIINQALEKYSIDIKEYKLDDNIGFSVSSVSKDIKILKNKIDTLGSINMLAIEEFEDISTRRDFVLAQKDEIERCIDVLEVAIEEIEETSKNKFLNTFNLVNNEFSNLFPILFQGGEARLELTDPQTPLNTGVEILVRLPGKKFQRMSLLSGGEKALTGISLIFALLKTKPSPFCFLDEVDAALDEANVGRFNRVIEALSEKFQFIIITHNRRTIEFFDRLYGITMQEPGVSSIIGVDLSYDLPNHLKKQKPSNRVIEGASAIT